MIGGCVTENTFWNAFTGNIGRMAATVVNVLTPLAQQMVEREVKHLIPSLEPTQNAVTVYKQMRDGGNGMLYSLYAGMGTALARMCGVENISYASDGTDPVTGEQYSTLYRFFLYKYGEFQLVTTAFGIYGAMEAAVGKLGGAMSKAPTQMEAALPKVNLPKNLTGQVQGFVGQPWGPSVSSLVPPMLSFLCYTSSRQ